jgi:hypothetical protein
VVERNISAEYETCHTTHKILIDEFAVVFYYHSNTGKEVIKKYMSSNHSEVAET